MDHVDQPISLSEAKKTIKPVAAGGQAGGEKYIVQGIFFKFALDIFGIYGGDEYAMYLSLLASDSLSLSLCVHFFGSKLCVFFSSTGRRRRTI
jgi:hypothetical protein